jgi:hypothetical protein
MNSVLYAAVLAASATRSSSAPGMLHRCVPQAPDRRDQCSLLSSPDVTTFASFVASNQGTLAVFKVYGTSENTFGYIHQRTFAIVVNAFFFALSECWRYDVHLRRRAPGRRTPQAWHDDHEYACNPLEQHVTNLARYAASLRVRLKPPVVRRHRRAGHQAVDADCYSRPTETSLTGQSARRLPVPPQRLQSAR